jgi:biotin synthase-like enzyme
VKRIEMVLSIFLIAAGLICLTMSGTIMFEQGIAVYLKTFVHICFLMGIPIILVGVFYLWYKKRGDKFL